MAKPNNRKAKKAKEQQNEKQIHELKQQVAVLQQQVDEQKEDSSQKKVRVNISITDATHKRLKAYATAKNTNVSKLITDWIWSTRFDK